MGIVIKKLIVALVVLIGMYIHPVFAVDETVQAEFLEALKIRVSEYVIQQQYDASHVQGLKIKLQDATQSSYYIITREVLTELVQWMDQTYPFPPRRRDVISSITDDLVISIVPPSPPVEVVSSIANPLHQDVVRYRLKSGEINITLLQNTWLKRVNDLRAERGRVPLSLHLALNKTAADRSETMKAKGEADHRRNTDSGYYDYSVIEKWFTERGVEFVNVSRATFTENVGLGTFVCQQSDCTDGAIQAMRGVFAFYLREEGTSNDAHRRTLIHPFFTVVGFGISVDEATRKLYMTMHYGTKIK